MSEGNRAAAQGGAFWQQLVVDAVPAVIWSTDRELRIVSCYGNALAALAPHPAQLSGTLLVDLFQTDEVDFPPIAAHREALAGRGSPISFSLATRAFQGHVAPLRSNDETVGCVTAAVDRQPFDARCHAISDTSASLILLRPDGTIEDVNRTPSGSTRDYVIGKTVFHFVPADGHDRLRHAIETVRKTGNVATLEMRFLGRVGRESWQVMRIGPVRYDRKVKGLVLLATDVTKHKKTVRKLKAEEGLLRDLLELQDRERRMVACEIHDGFIQDVIGARMLMQGIRQTLGDMDPSVKKQLDSAVSLLGRAVNEGRRLINELRPMIIDEMGIIDAINYLISEEESRSSIEIHFTQRAESDSLPPMLQATIFRIVRESLANARRHSGARRVEIRLTQIGQQYVILEIQDDGVGFDLETVPHDRYGLAGICDRAKLFGGGATIESSPGHGTRITVKLALDVPFETNNGDDPDWTWTT